MGPFKKISAWWAQVLSNDERKHRERIAADPQLRAFFGKRREDQVRAGCQAAFVQMNLDGHRHWQIVMENMHYTGGDQFPGKWKATFERIE